MVVAVDAGTDEPRNVHVDLAAEPYAQAIDAHRTGRRVRVVGTLAKVGRSWSLREPSGFELLPADEPEDAPYRP
jgi:hypothetical protein